MPSDDSPPRKRARVDSGDDGDDALAKSASGGVQRDEDVWFLDGNIVVIAKKTVAFRVHKGILSLRSEVLRDMFSLPNADAAATETFDGCPAFEVEDSPEDIRRLFLVLCCGKNYYYDQDALVPVPFDVLDSLIRMSHKYMVQNVLDDALSRLKKYYPNDLSAWQDSDARAQYVMTETDDAPTVIQLARLTDTLSLLPTAYLTCVQLSTDCYVKSDGSFYYPADELSFLDLTGVIAAKEHLTQACATRVLVLLSAVPAAHCTTPRVCRVAREAPLTAVRRRDGRRPLPISDDEAFRPIAERLWGEPHWGAFCRGCRQALLETDQEEMKELWSDLPREFGIDLDENSWPRSSGNGPGIAA